MSNIRPAISYKELSAARSIAADRLKENKSELKSLLFRIFFYYLTFRLRKVEGATRLYYATKEENTLLICTIIDVDEFYYKQVATIEHQIDINYPII